jgi:hypothetical protein
MFREQKTHWLICIGAGKRNKEHSELMFRQLLPYFWENSILQREGNIVVSSVGDPDHSEKFDKIRIWFRIRSYFGYRRTFFQLKILIFSALHFHCNYFFQCCGSGSGIRRFFTPWIRIRDEFFPDPGSRIQGVCFWWDFLKNSCSLIIFTNKICSWNYKKQEKSSDRG